MKNLPPEILAQFIRGEYISRHIKGYWNGILTNMFIEMTLMRYVKGPNRFLGLTLKPRQQKYGLIAYRMCNHLTQPRKHAGKTGGCRKAS